ncbi:MAG TPA: hypothetical protein VGO65_12780 [Pseudolysinimonas sp.]|nr:hypothetical protein [Pseudolysinimonas sp.]
MKVIRVIAGEREYYLSSETDLEALKSSALHATRGGGGLVQFVEAGGREVGIIVSAGVPISFEVSEIADDAGEPGVDLAPFHDFDF